MKQEVRGSWRYLHANCETVTALTLHFAARATLASQGGGACVDHSRKWVQGSSGHLRDREGIKINILLDFHFLVSLICCFLCLKVLAPSRLLHMPVLFIKHFRTTLILESTSTLLRSIEAQSIRIHLRVSRLWNLEARNQGAKRRKVVTGLEESEGW